MSVSGALPPRARTLTTAPREEAAELAEARQVLATLRAASSSGITFGGRIAGATCSAGATLGRYYDAVSVARSLGDIAALHGARLALSHQVPLPDEMRGALRKALQVRSGPAREAPDAVGNTAHASADELVEAARDGSTPFAPDEASVRRFFAAAEHPMLSELVEHAPEAHRLNLVRTFARGQEQVGSLDASIVGDWSVVANALPSTPEAASVLLRLAHAYAKSPSSIPFAGGALQSDALVANGAELARPLGEVSASPHRIAQSIARSDSEELALDDPSVERLADTWKAPDAWVALLGKGSAALSIARIAARASELGHEVAFPTEDPRVRAALTESSSGRQVLGRLAQPTSRLSEETVEALRALMPEPYAAPRARKAAGAAVYGPMGRQTFDAEPFEDLVAKGPAALRLSDAVYATLSTDQVFDAVKAHESNPELVLAMTKAVARGLEIDFDHFIKRKIGFEWWATRTPDTAETRGLLAQIQRAYDPSVREVDLGPRGRLLVDPLPQRPLAGELGTTRLDAAQLDAALKRQDPALKTLSDDTIEALFSNHPSPAKWPAPVHLNAQAHATRLGLVLRGLDIQATGYNEVSAYLETLAPEVRAHPDVMRYVAAFHTREVAHSRDRRHRTIDTMFRGWGPLEDARSELEAFVAVATEPRARRYDAARSAPLGERVRDAASDWKTKDPALFSGDDESLAALEGSVDLAAWHDWWGDARVLRLAARCIEIGIDDGASTRAFLANPLPPALADAATLPDLARLARAASVDAAQVRFLPPIDGAKTLAEHPEFAGLSREVTAAGVEARHAPYFDALKPGSGADDEARRSAVLDLLNGPPARERMEARELLDAVVQLRAEGALAPIEIGAAEAQSAFLEAVIRGVGHGGLGLMFAATVMKSFNVSAISDTLVRLGWPEDDALTWSGIAAAIHETDGDVARAWLKPAIEGAPLATASFATVMMLDEVSATSASMRRAIAAVEDEAPIEFLVALLEDVAKAPTPERQMNVRNLVRSLIDEGKLSPGTLDAQGRSDLLAILDATLEPRIESALAKIARGDATSRRVGKRQLVDVLSQAAELGDASELAERSLRRVLQLDLDRTLPLDVADERISMMRPDEERAPKDSVEVAGIPLARNTRPDRDLSAIPREEHAQMVMTPTTEANLRRLAVGWRSGQAVLLEGPTGAGKTAAVRLIAHLTGTPYRRINLTYHTEVDDLIGRYVAGENGEPPRWVDGPLIEAMRKGEVLLLDEINLARPEVLERLNSLLDGDGNIVLTQHDNEVITPAPEFRVVATMNPATYSGRGDLSDAFRSRWNTVFTHGLDQQDIRMVLAERYGDAIPPNEAIKLIKAHEALARAADAQAIGRKSGGIAFTLRNLFRATDRFLRYRGGDLDDAALLRRETEEVYLGGLFEESDVAHVRDVLDATMPYDGPGFYDGLELVEDADTVTIGDVVLARIDADDPLVPSEKARLVPTKRTLEIMYRLAKAMDMGENAALVGERASGKTAIAKMMAMLRGQPYARQNLNGGTDSHQLIGGYGPHGWEDGLIAKAGRPGVPPSVVVLDEYNLGAPAVVERLNSLFDDERKLVLAEKAPPEEIRFADDVHFIATFNPPTRKYAGRSKLSPAAMNRFTPIWVPALDDPEEQLEILRTRAEQHGVDKVVAATLVELHDWIVKGYEEGRLGAKQPPRLHPVYSVRTLEKAIAMIGELADDLGLDGAYLAAIESLYGASADPDDTKAIFEMAREFAE